jgi:hypothetical protein
LDILIGTLRIFVQLESAHWKDLLNKIHFEFRAGLSGAPFSSSIPRIAQVAVE